MDVLNNLFVIGGAGKSGTSSLWRMLERHPQICMAAIKEPGFFTRIPGRDSGGGREAPSTGGKYGKGLDWYLSLFEPEKEAVRFGEASTLYMHSPDTPDLLLRHAAQVKVIFVLRDPVDRLYSQYWFERQKGASLPEFRELVQRDHPRFRRYVENSSYRKHLERFAEAFAQQQILYLLLDDLKQSPYEVLCRTCAFLGIDPPAEEYATTRRHNPTGMARFFLLQRGIRLASRSRMKRLVPQWAMSVLRGVKARLVRANTVDVRYPPMDADLRRELLRRFASDIEYVEEVLGKDLAEWKKG